MAKRCVNIDWLEVYAYEPNEPRDIEYFVSCGLMVQARDYGTKHWEQVFTLLDDTGAEFLEVRRKPRPTATGHHAILPDDACTLRVVNRYCYYDTVCWILNDFMIRHRYTFRRIYRLDLCIDFKRFDRGDDPQRVMKRIVNHVYTKVYQSERTIHGRDHWSESTDNSISWGRKRSMVVTRMYNKSLELATVKDKPWIRQAWYECGLIDDPIAPVIIDHDGNVIGEPVWRVEFQINSSARGYYKAEGDGRDLWVEHTLETYWNRQLILQAIATLCEHYFNFRIFKQGRPKYECERKVLFDFKVEDTGYHLTNSVVRRTYDNTGSQILRWIEKIRTAIPSAETTAACNQLEAKVRQLVRVQTGFEGNDPKVYALRAAAPDITRGLSDEEVRDLFADVF